MTKRDLARLAGLAEGAKTLGINLEALGVSPEAESKAPAANKYGAKPKVYNGVRYASTAEADRAEALDGLAKYWWIGQPKFRLGCPENVYVADFLVVDQTGAVHVEDVKGVRTPKFARDVRLWKRYGPCDLWIITGGRVVEIIHPGGEP